MNQKYSGLSYYRDYHSDDMRFLRGGMREVSKFQFLMERHKNDVSNHHDVFSYERGTVYHSRNPCHQKINFHYMYGGVKKFLVDRYFVNYWYKRYIRNLWGPTLIVLASWLISSMPGHEELRQQGLQLLFLLGLSSSDVTIICYLFIQPC